MNNELDMLISSLLICVVVIILVVYICFLILRPKLKVLNDPQNLIDEAPATEIIKKKEIVVRENFRKFVEEYCNVKNIPMVDVDKVTWWYNSGIGWEYLYDFLKEMQEEYIKTYRQSKKSLGILPLNKLQQFYMCQQHIPEFQIYAKDGVPFTKINATVFFEIVEIKTEGELK